jgi:hypothetical protein
VIAIYPDIEAVMYSVRCEAFRRKARRRLAPGVTTPPVRRAVLSMWFRRLMNSNPNFN